MDSRNAVQYSLTHEALQLILVAIPTFKHRADAGVTDRSLFAVCQQILLADIRDIAAFGIFREQVIKWLIFDRPNGLGYRFIPLVAVGEHGINVENDAAKVKNAVADHITDGKCSFSLFRKRNL